MGMPIQLQRAQRIKRRRGSPPRTVLEELPAIDARWLTRHRMIPRNWDHRGYDFTFVNPAFPRLTITAHTVKIGFRDGRQQIVQVHWQTLNGMCQGAIRPLFGCPRCNRRAFRLYDLHGALRCSKCAVAAGAIYACQAQSAKGRAALQSVRLRNFLGGWAGRAPAKPLFMQKRTYRRLSNQLRELEAKSRTKRRAKAIHKLGHNVTKPTQMYRTQLTSAANA
jgi:hypothetical protein